MSSTDFAATASFLVARPYPTAAAQRPDHGTWRGERRDAWLGDTSCTTGLANAGASAAANASTSAHMAATNATIATVATKRRDPGALGALT